MTDPFEKLQRVAVLQGQVKASSDPNLEFTTVLGSCVAMCLYDEKARLGGMNHYLLSSSDGQEDQEKKYGLYAFECLLNEILKNGGSRFDLRAKVFGGASMGGKFSDVGPKNAAFALETCANEGIECTAQEIGGSQARKLRFIPSTGEARLMRVARIEEPKRKANIPTPVAIQAPEFF